MQNEDILRELRKSRLILGTLQPEFTPAVTFFIGLYNASKYLDSIVQQIEYQKDKDVFVVMVDNSSSDDTWERILNLPETLPGRLLVCKNDFNLGGLGSLLLNLDLVKTDWFSLIHQDDVYMKHHFGTFNQAVSTCDNEVVAISTSMASMDVTGKILGRSIRSQWLLKEFSQPDMFIANLHTQTVPWPSTAFKSEHFRRIRGFWTSSAFSDTELTLLLTAYGKFKFLNLETMFYRENPYSESHLVTSEDREMTTFLSLVRVFNSKEFLEIIKMVNPENRDNFVRQLDAGIEIRVKNSLKLLTLRTMSHEIVANEWGYSNIEVINSLQTDYNEFASEHSQQLLQRIATYSESIGNRSESGSYQKKHMTKPFEPNDVFALDSRNTLIRRLYIRYGGKIPFKIAKVLLVNFIKLKILFSKNHRFKHFG